MTILYSSLIRTFNSADTLPDTLHSLSTQTISPHEYIFVDSGSTDATLTMLPDGYILHKYIGLDFNYSEALNQGLRHVSTDYVLIISSHTILMDRRAIEYALNLLTTNALIGAAYFSTDNTGDLRYKLIDKMSFDGYNGLWNTCSLIKVNLLRQRQFRREVFTAEDQEWARWLLHCDNKKTACIDGAGMNNSRNGNATKYGRRKQTNEYIAIAYFANRRLLGIRNLSKIAYNVIKPTPRISMANRLLNLNILFALIVCHFVEPKYKSKYF